MNMSPSPEEWFYIVLVVDAFLLAIALVGIKLLGVRMQVVGVMSLLVGVVIFVLGVKNQIEAPATRWS